MIYAVCGVPCGSGLWQFVCMLKSTIWFSKQIKSRLVFGKLTAQKEKKRYLKKISAVMLVSSLAVAQANAKCFTSWERTVTCVQTNLKILVPLLLATRPTDDALPK